MVLPYAGRVVVLAGLENAGALDRRAVELPAVGQPAAVSGIGAALPVVVLTVAQPGAARKSWM